ncbi:MAG: hypothetical protein AAGI11_04405 [Pseudomonadota bacterium]
MQLCREGSLEALDALMSILRDETASHRDRVAAAKTIIEHGYGKPVDRVAMLKMEPLLGKTPEQMNIHELRHEVLDKMTNEYLDNLEEAGGRRIEIPGEEHGKD